MTRDEFLKKSGDKSKVKGYEEFGEAEKTGGKGPIEEFPEFPRKLKIYKPNGDKSKPPTPPKPPTTPAGVIPKAAMKHEEFKSFSEWLNERTF